MKEFEELVSEEINSNKKDFKDIRKAGSLKEQQTIECVLKNKNKARS